MTRRERARLVQGFVWPVTLIVVGLGLRKLAFALAASEGLTFRLYGVIQGVGDLVVLIAGVWLVVAVVRAVVGRVRRRGD